jgi:D-glycero-alpha-D-manno-heptose 1-phosphate guanylyltransferase
MIKDIDVFILCGGLGSRLRAVSKGNPKPMVIVNGRPFVDSIIDYFAGFGCRRFVLGTGYKAKVIEDYYCENKRSELKILFSREKTPLGTGGAVKKARKLLASDPVLVINGDSICSEGCFETPYRHKVSFYHGFGRTR